MPKINVNGLETNYTLDGPDDAPALTFVPGQSFTLETWAGQVPAFRDRFRVLTLDLRGHGASEWVQTGHYRFADYGRDADAIVEQVADLFGEAPSGVGASLGGLSLLTSEINIRPRLSSLVLVDVVPRMNRQGVAHILAFMASRLSNGFASLEEAADAIAAYLPHRKRPRSLEGLRKNLRVGEDGRYRAMAESLGTGYRTFMLGFFLLQSFFTSLISKLITVPHLLLVGRAFRTIQRVNHTAYSGELCIAKNLLMGGAGVVHTLMMCREGYCFWRWRQAVRETSDPGTLEPDSITAVLVGVNSPIRVLGLQRQINTYQGEALSAIMPEQRPSEALLSAASADIGAAAYVDTFSTRLGQRTAREKLAAHDGDSLARLFFESAAFAPEAFFLRQFGHRFAAHVEASPPWLFEPAAQRYQQALSRPAGHHATANVAMGFGLVNYAAAAVAAFFVVISFWRAMAASVTRRAPGAAESFVGKLVTGCVATAAVTAGMMILAHDPPGFTFGVRAGALPPQQTTLTWTEWLRGVLGMA